MSQFILENSKFQVEYGVDPTGLTSVFVQVYDKREEPVEDKDGADIVVDNQGVQKRNGINELNAYLNELQLRFQAAARHGNLRPNLHPSDVCDILTRLGLTGHEGEVYANLS